jgi:hypothetical protein
MYLSFFLSKVVVGAYDSSRPPTAAAMQGYIATLLSPGAGRGRAATSSGATGGGRASPVQDM